jgi:hypothetical protein
VTDGGDQRQGPAHRLFQITDADQTSEVIEDAEELSGADP